MGTKEYWKLRAKRFSQLTIPGHASIVKSIIRFGRFTGDEKVLDMGAGDGAITNSLSPLVKLIIGMDISYDMLETGDWQNNVVPIVADIRKSYFLGNSFDTVIASYVLQHTRGYTLDVLKECHRILKDGSSMIIVLPVPPHDDLKGEFAKIFSFKDDRIVLLPSEILELFKSVGFETIEHEFLSITIDLIDWLDNSMLSPTAYQTILDLHVNASTLFKKSYNMRVVENKHLIDTKAIVVRGIKVHDVSKTVYRPPIGK